jgi:hypothetical protein
VGLLKKDPKSGKIWESGVFGPPKPPKIGQKAGTKTGSKKGSKKEGEKGAKNDLKRGKTPLLLTFH